MECRARFPPRACRPRATRKGQDHRREQGREHEEEQEVWSSQIRRRASSASVPRRGVSKVREKSWAGLASHALGLRRQLVVAHGELGFAGAGRVLGRLVEVLRRLRRVGLQAGAPLEQQLADGGAQLVPTAIGTGTEHAMRNRMFRQADVRPSACTRRRRIGATPSTHPKGGQACGLGKAEGEQVASIPSEAAVIRRA